MRREEVVLGSKLLCENGFGLGKRASKLRERGKVRRKCPNSGPVMQQLGANANRKSSRFGQTCWATPFWNELGAEEAPQYK